MESKSRIKPNWFLTSENETSTKLCSVCNGVMERVQHTPKDKPTIYHCLRCGRYSGQYHFGISDLR